MKKSIRLLILSLCCAMTAASSSKMVAMQVQHENFFQKCKKGFLRNKKKCVGVLVAALTLGGVVWKPAVGAFGLNVLSQITGGIVGLIVNGVLFWGVLELRDMFKSGRAAITTQVRTTNEGTRQKTFRFVINGEVWVQTKWFNFPEELEQNIDHAKQSFSSKLNKVKQFIQSKCIAQEA